MQKDATFCKYLHSDMKVTNLCMVMTIFYTKMKHKKKGQDMQLCPHTNCVLLAKARRPLSRSTEGYDATAS